MDGILNVYKEKGFTSHDVVAKLRGIVKQKKIGHTGTLDPEAEGVLPVCLGNATKLCDLLTDRDKTYETVLKLGVTTDTQDMTGTVTEEKEAVAEREVIQEAILSFVGPYSQTPPMYSALKVNGRKLYELAREGIEIERKARQVTIHQIEIYSMDIEQGEIRMSVTCSKGTYIRTLCHDIGQRLGCGGCMKSLIRTRAGRFYQEDSLTLSQVELLQKEERLEARLVKAEDVFSECKKVIMKKEFDKLVYNGNLFQSEQISQGENHEDGEQVRVYDSENRFLGIYMYTVSRQYKPVKMFL